MQVQHSCLAYTTTISKQNSRGTWVLLLRRWERWQMQVEMARPSAVALDWQEASELRADRFSRAPT
jgi:hypothetical protein